MKKIIALLLAVLVVMAAFAGCSDSETDSSRKRKSDSGNSSYEQTVESMFKLMFGQYLSEEEVRAMQPEEFLRYLEEEEEGFDGYYKDVLQQLKTNKEAVEEQFGEDATYSYEIVDEKALSEEDMKIATAHLLDEVWYNPDKLKAVSELVIEIKINDDPKVYTMEMSMMQIGKAWYVLAADPGELGDILG